MNAGNCYNFLVESPLKPDAKLYVQVGFNRFPVVGLQCMPDGTGLFSISEDADNPEINMPDADLPPEPIDVA